jgi:hypothetical protein
MIRTESIAANDRLCDSPLLLAAARLASGGRGNIVIDLVVVAVAAVLRGGDPQARLAAVKGLVLARQIDGLAVLAVAAALRESAGTSGELGRDGCVLLDPVGESILAVLDVCLASLVSIVRLAGLARGDGGVVDQLEEVLAVASDDGELLAVLAHGIELVGEGSLELLAGDVGQLGLCDQGLGLSADKLLLENDNLGRVGLLVLELRNLVGDFLLACGRLATSIDNCIHTTYDHGWAGRKPQCCGCS